MEAATYKCPGCGAVLEFSIEHQAWACGHCRSEYSLGDLAAREEETQAGRPASFETARPALDGGEVRAYRCQSCGADILTDRNTAATFCSYCRSSAIIPDQLGDARQPDCILPFKLAKQKATELLLEQTKTRPFVPSGFRRDLRDGVMTGLYVPFWLFSCNARGYFEAECDQVKTWSDSKYRYVKTDTYHVIRDAEMRVNRVPVDASDKMDDQKMKAIEPFDYAQLEPFALQYLSGHYADSYDMTPEAAAPLGRKRMDDSVRDRVRRMVSGYSAVRQRRMDVYRRNEALDYAMLPVWTFVYRYSGKDYSYSINGQTGKISGKLPFSAARIWVCLAASLAAGLGLGFLFAGGVAALLG